MIGSTTRHLVVWKLIYGAHELLNCFTWCQISSGRNIFCPGVPIAHPTVVSGQGAATTLRVKQGSVVALLAVCWRAGQCRLRRDRPAQPPTHRPCGAAPCWASNVALSFFMTSNIQETSTYVPQIAPNSWCKPKCYYVVVLHSTTPFRTWYWSNSALWE